MAESFMSHLADSVLCKLGSLALGEIFLSRGLEAELEKINRIIATIKAVLLDAEQRQQQNNAIEVWLRELKDLLHDIEDVTDEFNCQSNKAKVRRFFSRDNPLIFGFRMGHEFKNIRERVVEIASLKSDFGLSQRINDRPPLVGTTRVTTHSFVREADVIGRDSDKKKIIELLLRFVDSENVSVIPVVGIGGLGKTTLAKLAYNNMRVANHFEKMLWVCVSEEFDLKELIIKILKSIDTESKTSLKYADMEVDQLQKVLRESLDGTRYLLVLDDVWNEDFKKWHERRIIHLTMRSWFTFRWHMDFSINSLMIITS